MRITEVEPILLRGREQYRAASGAEEATDSGDWQMLVRVATDEGLVGWSDVETLSPAATSIISGESFATRRKACSPRRRDMRSAAFAR